MLVVVKKATRYLALAGYAALLRSRNRRWLLSVFGRALEELTPDGQVVPASPTRKPGANLTILVLSPENFRRDPEHLAAIDGVRVLQLPERWLMRTLYSFYPDSVKLRMYASFFNPAPEEPAYPAKRHYRAFLRWFLPTLYDRYGIDCVIGYHLHHVADVDWGAVSDELGKPYVIFQRECLFVSDHVINYTVERMSKLGRFEGSCVAVHNEMAMRTFEASGFVGRDRMRALGAIRMDEFVERLSQERKRPTTRRKVTLFAFSISSVYRDELFGFYVDVHMAYVRLARDHPEIDFVIKYKSNIGPSWRRDFARAAEAAGLDSSSLPNLTVTGTMDPQDLILESDAIAGFNSTTLLEAGIAGKRVVVPLFGTMAEPEFRHYLYFADEWDAFDVARSQDEFGALILGALKDRQSVPAPTMALRREMFVKYVSSLEGGATERHLALLRDLVEASRKQPAEAAERDLPRPAQVA